MPAVRGCSVLPSWWKPVPDHADSGESASVGRKNQFGVWGEQPGGKISLPAAVTPTRSSAPAPPSPTPSPTMSQGLASAAGPGISPVLPARLSRIGTPTPP